MSLSITLSNPTGHVYPPGVLVPGIVKLVMCTDQSIGEVDISFIVRSYVFLPNCYGSVASNSDYKSSQYLYFHRHNLYRGKYTHRRGTYVWPFVFQVPRCMDTRLSDHRRASGCSLNQSLPSSMSYFGSFHCGVEYVLEARLIRPRENQNIVFSSDLHVSRSITVRQPGEKPVLELEDGRADRVYNHDCRIRSFAGSLRNRAASLIRHNPQRVVNAASQEVRLSLLVPKRFQCMSEDPIPMFVSVFRQLQGLGESNDPEDMEAAVSSVRLRCFAAWIVVNTAVRVAGQDRHESKRTLLGRGSCDVEITGSVDSCGLPRYTAEREASPTAILNLGQVANLCLPPSTVPDFSTQNVFRAHCLQLKFTLEYTGHRFRFAFDKIPFVVVSGPQSSTPAHEMSEHALTSFSSIPEEDEYCADLPAYGE
jgi:hypothetical protein